ncbi:hypothetical protein ACLQ18_31475 [Streptomyces sp. DT193]|uniref:hypothetical protein n=1 Tax=Streptomyces sp. DT193 TaxID=3393418 RepID=UPI003CF188CB
MPAILGASAPDRQGGPPPDNDGGLRARWQTEPTPGDQGRTTGAGPCAAPEDERSGLTATTVGAVAARSPQPAARR